MVRMEPREGQVALRLPAGDRQDPQAVRHGPPFDLGQQDGLAHPDAERLFAGRMGATTVEVPSSHVAMVSHPSEVAELIRTAAEGLHRVA
jgi:hypothetical protein